MEEEALLRHLHVQAPDGRLYVGAAAVAALARLFGPTAPLGWLAERPGLAALAGRGYDWIARHRYGLSRCRGGACGPTGLPTVYEVRWRA